jgi:hypothetical protein
MQFKTKNATLTETKIIYNNKEITEVPHTKFIGLEIENTLSWNLHIDNIIKTLTVCFMLRSVKPYMTLSSLTIICYSLFHSVLSYGIIYWGHATNGRNLFILVIIEQGNRTSCRNLFKGQKMLPLKSQYIFSNLLFVIKNINLFTTNYDSHNIQIRKSNNFHLPSSSLTTYQNGAYFTGTKIFNKLPLKLKELVKLPRKFKRTLRRYLVTHCFIVWMNYIA